MNYCTFLGHRDCYGITKDTLLPVLRELILSNSVNTFYVGNQGNFDRIVYTTLRSLKEEYPQINYYTVLAYLTTKTEILERNNFENTIFPEGIENVPKRYAISWRNKWMINHSDIIIAYITHYYGNAYKFIEYAQHKNKKIINIANYKS